MSQQSSQTASTRHPSFLDSVRTYLFSVGVSDIDEIQKELSKLDNASAVFDYDDPPELPEATPTLSVTDCDSSDSDSDTESKLGRKVINLTPQNKHKDYSVLDECFEERNSLEITYHHSNDSHNLMEESCYNENLNLMDVPKKCLASVPYTVSDNETLNSVALKFNVLPNVIKEMNCFTTNYIFPGQSIRVPKEDSSKITTFAVQPSVQPLLPPKKSFFKYPMKRITRWDGSVAGTTLMTSNAFMFRAHVSDKLVIQNGQNTYNVSIPLNSISEILMFESLEKMLANIQSTTGTENACEKCAEIKYQLCHRTPHHSGEEDLMEVEEEELPQDDDLESTLDPLNNDYGKSFAGSVTPESNSLNLFLQESTGSGEIQLGQSPVYSPACVHEFSGFATRYSTQKRINPFTISENDKNKLMVPGFQTCIGLDHPLSNTSAVVETRLKRVDSDTSLATKAFFKKIDENTNQMQNFLENANKHEFSIFIDIQAICCTVTHGKPSYQFETEGGPSKAHFWVCVPEADVSELMENLFSFCPHLSAVDDNTNCLMRCSEDYWRSLKDAILPDRKPTFVPREVDTDLISEPFSGTLNYPSSKSVQLTEDMMGHLQPYLPCHIIGIDMLLVYSMRLHGMSLKSLYTRCESYNELPCLLLIKDTQNYIFGAYLSEGIVESPRYYGCGETFLFKLAPEPHCYTWQGSNSYFMMGTSQYFTVGAGDGNFALYLDEMLQEGTSNPSLTFCNEVLSSSSSFRVLDVEVWCFTDETVESDPDNDSLSSDKSRFSGQYRGNFYSIR